MALAGQDFASRHVVVNAVNQSVYLIYAAAPPAGKVLFQGFRFAYAVIPVALNVSDKLMNAFKRLFVLGLPVKIIRPSAAMPKNPHLLFLGQIMGYDVASGVHIPCRRFQVGHVFWTEKRISDRTER